MGRHTGSTARVVNNIFRSKNLKSSGKTYSEIAQILGLTSQRIVQYLRIRGISRKGNCERCGNPCEALHAHHENYETDAYKMYCPACHAKVHSSDFRNRGDISGKTHEAVLIGRALRLEREKTGIAAKQIAFELGISAQYLSDLEKGRRYWTVSLMERYTSALAK